MAIDTRSHHSQHHPPLPLPLPHAAEASPSVEVTQAAIWLASHLPLQPKNTHSHAHLRSQLADCLTLQLEAKLTGHWHPENPSKGSAYRSIMCINGRLDPILQRTARLLNIDIPHPHNFTLWIDPGSVSYQTAESSPVFTIWSCPSSSSSSSTSSESPLPPLSPQSRLSQSTQKSTRLQPAHYKPAPRVHISDSSNVSYVQSTSTMSTHAAHVTVSPKNTKYNTRYPSSKKHQSNPHSIYQNHVTKSDTWEHLVRQNVGILC